uniref:F-box domain-containing protein n=1 Tax=Oryza punctata TaxID=4537 RepID=A0A0E0LM31_ORYPU
MASPERLRLDDAQEMALPDDLLAEVLIRLPWVVHDVLDGRFLLDRDGGEGGAVLRILAVCDPLFRRYSLLPQIPEDLGASVRRQSRRGVAPKGGFDTFFAPISEEESTAAGAEPAFKVIWIAQCPDKLVAFVFSSVTGQWRAITSPCWGDLSPAFSRPGCRSLLRRSYAYGCFYWMIGNSGNLLVLDMCRMNFSVVKLPSRLPGHDIVECAVVEAGEGKLGMFAFRNCITAYALELYSTTMQNEGKVASEWSFESAVLMPSLNEFCMLGVTGKELYLQVSPICASGCYLLEFSTNPSCKKLEFVRRWCSNFSAIPVYRLPTISIITKHMKCWRGQECKGRNPPNKPPPSTITAAMASREQPDLADKLLEEVFVRLPTAADLARASFRRPSPLTGHAFLRRFRRLHPPPVLGILSAGFLAAQPPQPSAAAARGFADGRSLLCAIPEGCDPRFLVKQFAVCDPLQWHYLLPAIPNNLASLVNQSEIVNFEPFLCPAAEDEDGTSFRLLVTRSFEFSSINLSHGSSTHEMVIVEVVEGKFGIFTLCSDNGNAIVFLRYVVLRNDDMGTNKWCVEKIIPLLAGLDLQAGSASFVSCLWCGYNSAHSQKLDLTDELLEEVLVRLPTAADLVRASMACASFRRLITGHAFLRRFRRLHPPPVLGILAAGFLAAQPPHPSAAAARAFADPDAADFFCSFIPSRDRWCHRHFSDGRFLLSAIPEGSDPARDHRALVKEFAVCDPLYRRYLLLPAIPDDLASLVNESEIASFEPFLCHAAEDEEDTMFRVICLAQCEAKLLAFIYSRGSGQWHAVEFDGWRDLTRGTRNPYPSYEPELSGRYYAHGCFCWVMHWVSKLLVLDTCSFEFSSIDLPPGPSSRRMVIVEAPEGKLGLFTLCYDSENALYFLWYDIMENDDEGALQWCMKEIIPLHKSYNYNILGVAGGYLLLQGFPDDFRPKKLCFSLNLRTFELELFCGTTYAIIFPDMYAGFPPSLSLPAI